MHRRSVFLFPNQKRVTENMHFLTSWRQPTAESFENWKTRSALIESENCVSFERQTYSCGCCSVIFFTIFGRRCSFSVSILRHQAAHTNNNANVWRALSFEIFYFFFHFFSPNQTYSCMHCPVALVYTRRFEPYREYSAQKWVFFSHFAHIQIGTWWIESSVCGSRR